MPKQTCKKCGAVYNIKYNPPKKKNICNECGGELFVRKDDYSKAIKERLKIYHQQTLPVLKHYQKQGILFEVDGVTEARAVAALKVAGHKLPVKTKILVKK